MTLFIKKLIKYFIKNLLFSLYFCFTQASLGGDIYHAFNLFF